MSGNGNARNDTRISTSVVNSLGQPQDEAMLQIERSLDHLAQSKDESARGLLLNLCRLLTTGSGEALALPKEELIAKLQPKYTSTQISSALDQMQARGLILAGDGLIKLSSGVLSRLIHAKVQAETASQQKIEAFITNRYDYYLEKNQLLSERDVNYISTSLSEIVLSQEHQKFINESKRAIRKQKRRGHIVIGILIGMLSLVSILGIYSVMKTSALNKLNAELAKDEAVAAEDRRRQAAERADDAERSQMQTAMLLDTITRARDSLESKQIRINRLLIEISGEKDEAVTARKMAEVERIKADQRADENAALSAALTRYASEKEIETLKAQSARDTARQEKEISEELRNILLSRIVAKRSIALKEKDRHLKTYTAMLAYFINYAANAGDVLHPDIYRAVYYAAKNQNADAVIPATDLASGAIGSLESIHPASSLAAASDGTVHQFSVDPQKGAIIAYDPVFKLNHDPIRYVFHYDQLNVHDAFVLGAMDHIIQIRLADRVGEDATEVNRYPIPDKQFVKHAERLSDDQLIVQTADGALYTFDFTNGNCDMLLDASVGVVAWASSADLDILCYANTEDELILDNIKKTRARDEYLQYTTAKKRVAQMKMKQYGSTIYMVLGYVDGEIEVLISKDGTLRSYQRQTKGKNAIQSLRSSVHTGYIPAIEFAQSRPLVAVCSYDGTVSVWDLVQWENRFGDYQPLILDDHESWVTSCTFLPGDNTILTGSKLGKVKYWNLDPEVYARALCSKGLVEPSEVEWSEYIGDELLRFKDAICRENQ